MFLGIEPCLLALCLFDLTYAESSSCDATVITPFSAPVTNVTVANGKVWRGVSMGVGSPMQPLAFLVSAKNNNTYVFDKSGQCGTSSAANCATQRGGAFDESASTTWSTSGGSSIIQQQDDLEFLDRMIPGTDTVHLNSSLSVTSFPLLVPRQEYPDGAEIGLGLESSFLTQLRNSGTIASRTWSLFWGQTGIDPAHQMDGNLVIGGYDAAKVQGPGHSNNIKIISQCLSGLVVTVSDMSLVFPNGTAVSISANGPMNMCIDTGFNMITVPSTVWSNFEDKWPYNWAGRHPGNPNVWGMDYLVADSFPGDLKIEIDNDIDITIPNNQLVQYAITLDNSGNRVYNLSNRELMINPLADVNENDMPVLGQSFLQSAYLSVNQDNGTFSLWQSNPTTTQKLIGIGNSTFGCPTTPSPTATTGHGGTSAGTSSTTSKLAVSTGAIAGAAAGGSLLLLAIIVGAVLFLRRRKRAKEQQNGYMSGTSSAYDPIARMGTFYKPELDGTVYSSGLGISQNTSVTNKSSYSKYTDHPRDYFTRQIEVQELPANTPR